MATQFMLEVQQVLERMKNMEWNSWIIKIMPKRCPDIRINLRQKSKKKSKYFSRAKTHTNDYYKSHQTYIKKNHCHNCSCLPLIRSEMDWDLTVDDNSNNSQDSQLKMKLSKAKLSQTNYEHLEDDTLVKQDVKSDLKIEVPRNCIPEHKDVQHISGDDDLDLDFLDNSLDMHRQDFEEKCFYEMLASTTSDKDNSANEPSNVFIDMTSKFGRPVDSNMVNFVSVDKGSVSEESSLELSCYMELVEESSGSDLSEAVYAFSNRIATKPEPFIESSADVIWSINGSSWNIEEDSVSEDKSDAKMLQKCHSLPDLCFSDRDTRLDLGWLYPKGVKNIGRDMSRKQSKDSSETERLHTQSVQPRANEFPLIELGVADRNIGYASEWALNLVRREDLQRGHYIQQALSRLSSFTSDTENLFKQNMTLRTLFDWRFISLKYIERLQQIRNHFYPASLNQYWKHASTESPPSVEESMSVEWMRLQTFQNYPPSAHGSPNRLSREGFYYTGQGSQTRCYSCGFMHDEWNYLDNPREVHWRMSPNCPFLNGTQERYPNIPMTYDRSRNIGGAGSDSIPPPSLPVTPSSVSGTRIGEVQAEGNRFESREGSNTAQEDSISVQKQNSGSDETSPRIQSHPVEESAQSEADNRPKFPEHVSLPNRIATFSHGWPPYLDQTPQQMAEAGFFFTGNQDYTRCYQCGGGLRNWEPGDNPWIEHCRWYPTCPHVEKGKGQRFINAVLKKQAELV